MITSTLKKIVLMVVTVLGSILAANAQLSNLEKGKVIDTVRCNHLSDQTYALYLPSYYDTSSSWPVVYIFEPAARGTLAVNRFKTVAEKLGYVIVASNNARNGSWEIVFNAADAIFEDTYKRFSLDQSRVYTSGFSGGSRAAIAIASITGKVTGVIGCGAGFPPNPGYRPDKNDTFDYVGIVGDMDMNYQEHFKVENALDELGIANRLLHFHGRHHWPPTEVIYRALAWHHLQAMKKGIIKENKPFIEEIYQVGLAQLDSLQQAGNLIEQERVLGDLTQDFSGWYDVTPIKKSLAGLKNSKDYKKVLKRRDKTEKKERELRQRYNQAFTELTLTKLKVSDSLAKDEAWWENEVKYLKRLTNSKEVETAYMGERLLNMIWAVCAEKAPTYLANDPETAMVLSRIWLKIQPKSLWALVQGARIMSQAQKTDEALQLLERASENGMKNYQYLEKEPAFTSLRGSKRYESIIEKVKSNNNSDE